MIERVFGVDFSGARDAGEKIWIAEVDVASSRLVDLRSLAERVGTSERDAALAALAREILGSRDALWGIDAPLALPVELFAPSTTWRDQLAYVATFADAKSLYRELVARSRALPGGRSHVQRRTEIETKTPFSSYNLRIVHQTLGAMRDVLGRIVGTRGTVVRPFDALRGAERVVVEACPSSTLKRLGWPHHRYKETQRDPLRARNRAALVDRVRRRVHVRHAEARTMRENRGGDALDAVLAALGAWHGFTHEAPVDARSSREGRVYC